MADLLTPSQIESRAKAAGLSVADACKRAGIALSTFYRWKAGKTVPSIDVYQRLSDATASPPPSEAA